VVPYLFIVGQVALPLVVEAMNGMVGTHRRWFSVWEVDAPNNSYACGTSVFRWLNGLHAQRIALPASRRNLFSPDADLPCPHATSKGETLAREACLPELTSRPNSLGIPHDAFPHQLHRSSMFSPHRSIIRPGNSLVPPPRPVIDGWRVVALARVRSATRHDSRGSIDQHSTRGALRGACSGAVGFGADEL
jgi:hypothetical protein